MSARIESVASSHVGAASSQARWKHEIDRACQRIAPTWPLDQFIAVNPWWGRVDQPMTQAGAELAALSGATPLMPHSFYAAEWRAGRLQRADLQAALAELRAPDSVDELVAALENPDAPAARTASAATDSGSNPEPLPMFARCVDANRDLTRLVAWTDEITHQISQHCAAYFDRHQAAWRPASAEGLYGSWHADIQRSHRSRLLMGARGLRRRSASLPSDPHSAIDHALEVLAVPAPAVESYLAAALLSVNGWASWCAYGRWQARLAQQDDDHIIELLAIRLAWDALLDDGARGVGSAHAAFLAAWADPNRAVARFESQHRVRWVLQRALEITYQRALRSQLGRGLPPASQAAPRIQAAFCIDVRSEVFRRALESTSTEVATLGFAGFFGLPASYTPLATTMVRPQLPGLLAPAINATDVADTPAETSHLARLRCEALEARDRWRGFRATPGSAFTFVETGGWRYAATLLTASLPNHREVTSVDRFGLPAAAAAKLRPRLNFASSAAAADGPSISPIGAEPAIAMAAGVLGAMGLTEVLARFVLLAGHGSQSANNPHAAGLDCGACCGQTGEVNARALAALLNDPAVRVGLIARGIPVPQGTWFVAGLHNTTTDEVDLFDTDLVPDSHAADLAALQGLLAQAGAITRSERAPRLGLADLRGDSSALYRSIKSRANDWSQVRPEWALADCAAFVVAPRTRTRGIDLGGRSFLHDYHWQRDPDNSILELIMTAPMVVTHWINLQYYASTVDNQRYGSGNKVLHNVVGGRLGVFEGNGGDLRIGLPWQSLHDGRDLMHRPLRLSVFIEAPRERIDAVIARHAIVRQLLDHQWLHLFRIEPAGVTTERYTASGWSSE